MDERRKEKRYKLKDGNLVVHWTTVGNIENISRGGLCCSCINDEFSPDSYNKIDIRCPRKNFFLQDLGIKIVDKVVSSGESVFAVFTRKCHLQFEELSDEQMVLLDNFIENNAITYPN